ncbi:hypothetical protein [Nocardioides alkalitolerans]|uniref:hypothetical protein n=1 Tax=Nocardioides alkalitolerans TaxID=281714 RepID=UPI00048D3CEA|nr:hypothetical protein [Nocardioides alkalitolerans]
MAYLHDGGGPGTGGDRLGFETDSLITAAGGIRRIIDALDTNALTMFQLDESVTGWPVVAQSLTTFTDSWDGGLRTLSGDQLGIADALEACVEDFLGVDLDVAAGLRYAETGEDFAL